jgi:uncharacterized protein (DUF2267 family)
MPEARVEKAEKARQTAGAWARRVEAVAMVRRMRALAVMMGAAALVWCGRWARLHATRQAWLGRPCGPSDVRAGVACSELPERSEELEPLLAVASRAGLDRADGLRLARATVVSFAWCLPPVERIRFLAALPAGVRRLAAWPPRRTWEWHEIHTGDQLVRAVIERSGLTPTVTVDPMVRRMLTVLHHLAGPEASAVAAALPRGLRPIWTGSATTEHAGFSLARRVWGETPVRGEWGWMQASTGRVQSDLATTASRR